MTRCRRYRICNFMRLGAFLLILLAFPFLYAFMHGQDTQASTTQPIHINHMVVQGETLWDIAEFYFPNKDNRKVVFDIRMANKGTDGAMMSAIIRPGQVIQVPVEERESVAREVASRAAAIKQEK